MRPVLFQLGDVGVASYAVFLVLGICALLWVSVTVAERRALPGHRMAMLLTLAYLAGLAGGRIAWVLQSWRSLADPVAALLSPSPGGFTVYGALIGGTLAGGAYAAAARLPLGAVADSAVLGLALAGALGRLGCFAGGCCYGRPTELPWGVVFPPGSAPAARWGPGVAIHPSQLYEAAVLLLIGGACHALSRRRRARQGEAFLTLVVAYAAFRFFHELVRGDSHEIFLRLTPAQWMSLLLATAAAGLLTTLRRSRAPETNVNLTWTVKE